MVTVREGAYFGSHESPESQSLRLHYTRKEYPTDNISTAINGKSVPRAIAAADIALADSRWSFWQFRSGPFGDLCLRNPFLPLPAAPLCRQSNDNNAALEGSSADRQASKNRCLHRASEQQDSPNLAAIF